LHRLRVPQILSPFLIHVWHGADIWCYAEQWMIDLLSQLKSNTRRRNAFTRAMLYSTCRLGKHKGFIADFFFVSGANAIICERKKMLIRDAQACISSPQVTSIHVVLPATQLASYLVSLTLWIEFRLLYHTRLPSTGYSRFPRC
jgi:hypothetical protein